MATYTGADGNTYDWATGELLATGNAGAPSWWEQTLGHVITSVVDSTAKAKTLQPNSTYMVDANGNVVQTGVVHTPATATAAAVATNPMLMLALLAVGGFLLYKLVK